MPVVTGRRRLWKNADLVDCRVDRVWDWDWYGDRDWDWDWDWNGEGVLDG